MMKTRKSTLSYIKSYNFRSQLFRNFLCVMIGLMLPITIVIAFNYNNINDEMDHRMMEMNEELLQKSVSVTDNIMQSIFDVLDQLLLQEDVISVIYREEIDEEYHDKARQVQNTLQQYIQLNQYIKAIYLYSGVNQQILDANLVMNSKEYENKGKWYYVYKEIPFDPQWILVDDENSILLCKTVFSEKGESLGVVAFDIGLQALREMMENENIEQGGRFFIVDISGRIMYCSQLDYFTEEEALREKYRNAVNRVKTNSTEIFTDQGAWVVSTEESEQKVWKYALVTDVSAYAEDVGFLWNTMFYTILIGVITSILVSFVIAYITYLPVKK